MTRQFALVWTLTFVTFFAAFQLFPTVPLRLRELGASLAESGRFMSLFTAGSALGALFTGPLGDRVGHRRLVITAAVLYALFLGAYSLLSNRWGFYLLAVPHGIVWSGLLTATMASLAHVLPEDRRADGLSLYGLASPGGVIVGPLLGLWIFERWGFAPIGWYLALLFLLLGALARTLPVDHPHGRPEGFKWPDASVATPCLILFCVALGYGALGTYTAQEALALGMKLPSAFLSSMAVGMVIMRLAMLRRGFGRRPIRKLPGMLLGACPGPGPAGRAARRHPAPRGVGPALRRGLQHAAHPAQHEAAGVHGSETARLGLRRPPLRLRRRHRPRQLQPGLDHRPLRLPHGLGPGRPGHARGPAPCAEAEPGLIRPFDGLCARRPGPGT